MKRSTWCVGVVVVLGGCSGSSTSDQTDEYRRLNSEVAAAADQHRTNSTSTTTQEECRKEHDRYDAEARPRVQRMREISRDRKRCGGSQDGRGWGAMGQMCSSESDELDQYRTAACNSEDNGENRQTTTRHCAVMMDYARRQGDESDRAEGCSMMDGRGMM